MIFHSQKRLDRSFQDRKSYRVWKNCCAVAKPSSTISKQWRNKLGPALRAMMNRLFQAATHQSKERKLSTMTVNNFHSRQKSKGI
jgi:hypothetical protein